MRPEILAAVLLFAGMTVGEAKACEPPTAESMRDLTVDEVRQSARQAVTNSDAVIDARVVAVRNYEDGRVVLVPLRVLKGPNLPRFEARIPMCKGVPIERSGVSLRVLLFRFQGGWLIIPPPKPYWLPAYDDAVDVMLGNRRSAGLAHYPAERCCTPYSAPSGR